MEPKRTRTDISADMLQAIQNKRGNIKPTHLMYKANLSHAQLKSYLEELVEKELVEKTPNSNNNMYISITDKGHKFVQKWNEMKQFEKSFGL